MAVVLPQETDVYSGTDEGSVVLFRLHAAAEVAVTGRRPGWVRVILPDGPEGWLPSELVEVAP